MLDPINNPVEWRKYHLGESVEKSSFLSNNDDDVDISVALSGIDTNTSTIKVYDVDTPKGRRFIKVWPGGHVQVSKSQL